METRFTEFSDIQVFVENIVNITGNELIDTLFINLNSTEDEITIVIEDSTGDESNFIIKKENLQQIFDWLKTKEIIM